MGFPLANLVKNLSLEHFVFTKRAFGEKHALLTRKGVYSYDWMDSFEKFEETSLLGKEEFYSALYEDGIFQKDYEVGQKVWKEFERKNMGEYHDLYLKSDVMLLTDLLEEFRNTCQGRYGLEPCWYYTSPGLSWDALFKHSKVELELLTDPDMLLFLEQGTRGGILMISNRFGKANNPYIGEAFDPEKKTTYLRLRLRFTVGR